MSGLPETHWCLKHWLSFLGNVLPLFSPCTHIKGHAGAKAAVRAVANALPANTFVMRTDVKSFYESIDQYLLIDSLAAHVHDRFVLNLLWQVMRRSVTWGGLYKDCERGISRGCPLSPLLSGFVLYELDKTLHRGDTFYVRFMDDILILAPTRWKLRRAIKQVNTALARLNLAQHPDKTFIGRISRGFDFLGYHFSAEGLTVAQATVERFIEKANRLYEQEPQSRALGLYVRRWFGWIQGGLRDEIGWQEQERMLSPKDENTRTWRGFFPAVAVVMLSDFLFTSGHTKSGYAKT